MRNAKWYLNAYAFLHRFESIEMVEIPFLDGIYTHFCAKDLTTDEWLGPEVVVIAPEYRVEFSDRRMLT